MLPSNAANAGDSSIRGVDDKPISQAEKQPLVKDWQSQSSQSYSVVKQVEVVRAPWYQRLGFGKVYLLKMKVDAKSEPIVVKFRALNQGLFGKFRIKQRGYISNFKADLTKKLKENNVKTEDSDFGSLISSWKKEVALKNESILRNKEKIAKNNSEIQRLKENDEYYIERPIEKLTQEIKDLQKENSAYIETADATVRVFARALEYIEKQPEMARAAYTEGYQSEAISQEREALIEEHVKAFRFDAKQDFSDRFLQNVTKDLTPKEIDTLQTRVEGLLEDLAFVQENAEATEQLKKDKNTIEGEAHAVEREIENLSLLHFSENASLHKSLSTAEQQIEDKGTQVKTLTTQKEALQDSINKLDSKIANLKEKNDDVMSKLLHGKSQSSKRAQESANKEIQKNTEEIESLETVIKGMEEHIAYCTNEIQKLNEDIAQLQQKKQDYKQQLATQKPGTQQIDSSSEEETFVMTWCRQEWVEKNKDNPEENRALQISREKGIEALTTIKERIEDEIRQQTEEEGYIIVSSSHENARELEDIENELKYLQVEQDTVEDIMRGFVESLELSNQTTVLDELRETFHDNDYEGAKNIILKHLPDNLKNAFSNVEVLKFLTFTAQDFQLLFEILREKIDPSLTEINKDVDSLHSKMEEKPAESIAKGQEEFVTKTAVLELLEREKPLSLSRPNQEELREHLSVTIQERQELLKEETESRAPSPVAGAELLSVPSEEGSDSSSVKEESRINQLRDQAEELEANLIELVELKGDTIDEIIKDRKKELEGVTEESKREEIYQKHENLISKEEEKWSAKIRTRSSELFEVNKQILRLENMARVQDELEYDKNVVAKLDELDEKEKAIRKKSSSKIGTEEKNIGKLEKELSDKKREISERLYPDDSGGLERDLQYMDDEALKKESRDKKWELQFDSTLSSSDKKQQLKIWKQEWDAKQKEVEAKLGKSVLRDIQSTQEKLDKAIEKRDGLIENRDGALDDVEGERRKLIGEFVATHSKREMREYEEVLESFREGIRQEVMRPTAENVRRGDYLDMDKSLELQMGEKYKTSATLYGTLFDMRHCAVAYIKEKSDHVATLQRKVEGLDREIKDYDRRKANVFGDKNPTEDEVARYDMSLQNVVLNLGIMHDRMQKV